MKLLHHAYKRGAITRLTPASLQRATDMFKVIISTHRICPRALNSGRSWGDVKEDLEDFHVALAAAMAEWA